MLITFEKNRVTIACHLRNNCRLYCFTWETQRYASDMYFYLCTFSTDMYCKSRIFEDGIAPFYYSALIKILEILTRAIRAKRFRAERRNNVDGDRAQVSAKNSELAEEPEDERECEKSGARRS